MRSCAKVILINIALVLTLLFVAAPALAAGEWVTTRDGAMVWNSEPQPGETATWSGDRDAKGFADGVGVLKAYINGNLTATYEGPIANGRVTGKGKITWPSGAFYEGDFVDWTFQGKGFAMWANGNSYEGDYFDNKRQGSGIYKFADGTYYEGEFFNNQFQGKGLLKMADGSYYEGSFVNGQYHGYGKLYKPDGSVLKEGHWASGKFIG